MAHIHEKIDFTVSAYIVHPNLDKILLVHHKKFNGWLQIGGHIELDEDSDMALMREIEEECGLKVELLAKKAWQRWSGPEGAKPSGFCKYSRYVYEESSAFGFAVCGNC